MSVDRHEPRRRCGQALQSGPTSHGGSPLLARFRDDAVGVHSNTLGLLAKPAQQFERALARLKVILSVRGTLEGENGSYGVGGLDGCAQNFWTFLRSNIHWRIVIMFRLWRRLPCDRKCRAWLTIRHPPEAS